MKLTNITMLHDKILVFPLPERSLSTALQVIANTDPNKPLEGFVMQVGPGSLDKNDELIPIPVNVGDRIFFIKSGTQEIKYKDDTFFVISSNDILCRVNNVPSQGCS